MTTNIAIHEEVQYIIYYRMKQIFKPAASNVFQHFKVDKQISELYEKITLITL